MSKPAIGKEEDRPAPTRHGYLAYDGRLVRCGAPSSTRDRHILHRFDDVLPRKGVIRAVSPRFPYVIRPLLTQFLELRQPFLGFSEFNLSLCYLKALYSRREQLMNDSQTTRVSLLVRLSDGQDSEAWNQFIEIYSPWIYRHMRRSGLQEADAADVTQDVLRSVVRSVGGFDHNRRTGSFRRWLSNVARSRLSDFMARRKKQVQGSGETTTLETLNQQPANDDDSVLLECEYQKSKFEWAAGKVRHEFNESVWKSFWETYVNGRSCKDVAAELQVTTEAVYMSRGRVLTRLREKVRQVAE